MVGPGSVVGTGFVVSEFTVVDPAVLQSKLQSGSRQMQVVAF